MPNNSPNKQQRPWTGGNFDTLGWAPDGDVRGSYAVDTDTTGFMINGQCDVDGDGSRADFFAREDVNIYVKSGNNVY